MARMIFMRLLVAFLATISSQAAALTPGPEFVRLNKNDSVILPMSYLRPSCIC